MSSTGEKVQKGTYKCTNCGTAVTLDKNADKLPPCPKCNKTQFGKAK